MPRGAAISAALVRHICAQDSSADPHRYELERQLACTRNAQLFRAIARHSNGATRSDQAPAVPSFVVVKRMTLAREDARKRSDDPLRELQTFAQIHLAGGHSNLVECREAFLVDDQHLHLVFEYCQDGDLYDRLMAHADFRMPERDAMRVVLHLARGLQFLHQHGIAHRDISVENVLVHRGQFKLCDFGLSTAAHVMSRGCVGKAHYMAPEVASRAMYDPRKADLWSLGMLLFILLTGSPLVPLATYASPELQVFRQIGVKGVLRLWHMEHLASFVVCDLLTMMLEVDPDERIATIAQVLQHPALEAAAARERNALQQEHP